MSSPLTHHQKTCLAILSTRAFNRAAALARGQGLDPLADPAFWQPLFDAAALPFVLDSLPFTPSAAAEQFRHLHVAIAVRRHGLRCCLQDDYKRLEAHFLNLLGEPGAALNAHIRAETEPRRVAEYKLLEACRRAGLHLSHAEAICRRQNHGLSLDDVPAKTLWHLVFTINNRRKSKVAQASPPAVPDLQPA